MVLSVVLKHLIMMESHAEYMTADRNAEPVPTTCVSSTWPTPTNANMSILRQMPLKPTALDSSLSAMAHMIPVI